SGVAAADDPRRVEPLRVVAAADLVRPRVDALHTVTRRPYAVTKAGTVAVERNGDVRIDVPGGDAGRACHVRGHRRRELDQRHVVVSASAAARVARDG